MNLPTAHLTLLWTVFITNKQFENEMLERGTSALHFNEPTWIIDGFNELIVDFLFALVIFLDSTLGCTGWASHIFGSLVAGL